MGGLFGGGKQAAPQPLPTPKPVRMPHEQDTALLDAAKRTREAMLRRTGRLSTILTDNLKDSVGSSGRALGD